MRNGWRKRWAHELSHLQPRVGSRGAEQLRTSCPRHFRVPVTDVRRACLEGVEIAEAVGSRYSQIVASYFLATAYFVNGDYGACEERFTEALAQARGAGTALDWQSYYLAVFADACLVRGDAEAAISMAREGIEAADAGGAWLQAALARAALVDALVRQDAREHAVAPEIAAARELIRKSGGNSLRPRLREAEARLAGRDDPKILEAGLREAEAMYHAMGAPDPADRLAQELGVRGPRATTSRRPGIA